jgi:hypothetical protein
MVCSVFIHFHPPYILTSLSIAWISPSVQYLPSNTRPHLWIHAPLNPMTNMNTDRTAAPIGAEAAAMSNANGDVVDFDSTAVYQGTLYSLNLLVPCVLFHSRKLTNNSCQSGRSINVKKNWFGGMELDCYWEGFFRMKMKISCGHSSLFTFLTACLVPNCPRLSLSSLVSSVRCEAQTGTYLSVDTAGWN